MYLSSLLACQGWYCVNSYCVFPLLFLLCVCSGTLFLSPSTCARANAVYNVHSLSLLLGTCACANPVYNVHTLSLLLGTRAHANTVYNVHTLSLSLSTHACADTLLFIWHLCSCKHCLQCAHTHTFTQHLCSCFHSVFALLQTLSIACTHSSSNSALSCKHCLQTICSMCEKLGLEPEPSLSQPALRAPAQPMD